MLSLQLKSGEYLTIGDEIAVQIFEESGSTFRVAVKAPREIPILRGEVLERTGERPGGLREKRPKSPSAQARDAQRLRERTEQRSRAEAERRRAASEQAAVTRELRSILARLDELAPAHDRDGLRKTLDALRARLDGIPEANDYPRVHPAPRAGGNRSMRRISGSPAGCRKRRRSTQTGGRAWNSRPQKTQIRRSKSCVFSTILWR